MPPLLNAPMHGFSSQVTLKHLLPGEGMFVLTNACPNLPFQVTSVRHPPKQPLSFNPPIQSPGVNPVLTQSHSTDLMPTIVKTPGVLISPH